MEKLITKRNIFIASGVGILLIILAYFFLLNSNKESEKYFDIYLANLYNEDSQGIDQKMEYLSKVDDPNISFFANIFSIFCFNSFLGFLSSLTSILFSFMLVKPWING